MSRRWWMAGAALLPGSAALAFCGTYVGGTGDSLHNDTSVVSIVREGTRTVLTMANDVRGDVDDFALVVPVPEVLQKAAVRVVDPVVFDRLEAWSQPRLVAYDCVEADTDTDTDTDTDSDTDADTDTDVQVEAQYVVGEYDVSVLSASESRALFTWLSTHGYDVPESSVSLLQDYIDAGSYFLAAQVYAEAGVSSGDRLSPLQLVYDTSSYGVPIRLGTLNAAEVQELLVFAIDGAGTAAISSYPEVAVEDECLFPGEQDDFADFYARLVEEAWHEANSGVWLTEYAWRANGCDPCPTAPPSSSDLHTLGYDMDAGPSPWVTRLRMRYAPDQAKVDVGLYQTGATTTRQQRYIVHEHYLEASYPICEQGWAEDPDTACEQAPPEATDDDGGGRCSGAPPGVWGPPLVLLAMRRRGSRRATSPEV